MPRPAQARTSDMLRINAPSAAFIEFKAFSWGGLDISGPATHEISFDGNVFFAAPSSGSNLFSISPFVSIPYGMYLTTASNNEWLNWGPVFLSLDSIAVLDADRNQISGYTYWSESGAAYPFLGGSQVSEPSSGMLIGLGIAALLARVSTSRMRRH
jgi:hypothetical protein